MLICVCILIVNMPTACITNVHVQYFMIKARLLFVLKCNFIFIAKSECLDCESIVQNDQLR